MARGTPLFSVIVTTHDRSDLLREAVGSVFAQTVDDLEIVVVDDASPEPVRLPRDPRLRILHQAVNAGVSAARNRGLAEARGRYVTFLDDDDVLTPDRLEIALDGLRAAPLTVCGMRYLHPDAVDDVWARDLSGDVSGVVLEGLVPHVGQAAFERREALPFDEAIRGAEDVEWWIRMSQHVHVASVPRVGYLFRRHDGPRHGNDLVRRIHDRQAVLDQHAAFFAAHPRSAAFQWKRIGLMALQAGQRDVARRAFVNSLAQHLEGRVMWHMLRSFRPTGGTVPELVRADRSGERAPVVGRS